MTHISPNMLLSPSHIFLLLLTAPLLPLTLAQTLKIPTRSGAIIHLPTPSTIRAGAPFDGGNREYDRGRSCNSDADKGSENAVFILEDGAKLSNVIIGADSLEGMHCNGRCEVRNVWFRDVCEGEFVPCHFLSCWVWSMERG